MTYRTRKSGFTLVEILIVVIILGILAAIVIPQFTNASEDARLSSLRSTLQTLRSQIELYKLQHLDLYPTDAAAPGAPAAGNWDWDRMIMKTDENGDTTDDPDRIYGPYMQQPSQNGLHTNSLGQPSTLVQMQDTDAAAIAAVAGVDDGFVFSRETGKSWAFDRDGTVRVSD